MNWAEFLVPLAGFLGGVSLQLMAPIVYRNIRKGEYSKYSKGVFGLWVLCVFVSGILLGAVVQAIG